jgi:predicted deacylase
MSDPPRDPAPSPSPSPSPVPEPPVDDDVPAPPGKSRRTIPVSTLASGFALGVSTLTIRGAAPGPHVGVSAMVHGDEIEGALILRELWRTIDPATLSGTLTLMPVANPLALDAISRNTPLDMLDMNRLFPGAPDGWLSEQMAFAIGNEFLAHLDFYVDIHAGGTFPWVDYCYVVNDEAFSRAFLSELLYQPAQIYAGTTATFTSARGIPTTVVEIGGGYHDQATHIRNGVQGVLNMLRHAGALPGPVEPRPRQTLLRTIKVMRPRHGGLCVPVRPLRPGTLLDGHVPLAEIVSPHTFERLEILEAPFEKNVVVLSRNFITRIQPGDYTYMMGDGASATHF